MVCPKCQSELRDGVQFCELCGAAVTASTEEVAEVTEKVAEVTEEVTAVSETAGTQEMPTEGVAEAVVPPTDETAEDITVETEIAVKKKPIGWMITAIVAVAALVGVGAFFLWQMLYAGPLAGTWRVSANLSEMVSFAKESADPAVLAEALAVYGEENGLNLENFDVEKLLEMMDVDEPLTVYLQFDKETFDVIVNIDELGDAVNKLYDNVLVYVENGGLYEIYEMQGYSREEIDAMLGMSLDGMLSSMRLAQAQLKAEMAKALEEIAFAVEGKNYTLYSGGYTYEDGLLSLKEIPMLSLSVAVEGQELKLNRSLLVDASVVELVDRFLTIERAQLPQ